MSTTLTIYSHDAFKSFLLPAINDADYSLLLARGFFNISNDIELLLTVDDNGWRFVRTREYELITLDGGQIDYATSLEEMERENNNELKLKHDDSHILSIIIRKAESCFGKYNHYDISQIEEPITIGRTTESNICFDYNGKKIVSTEHAVIFNNGNEYFFQDNGSANGSYLMGHRVNGSEKLAFGDCIDIYGLRIVFLGNEIAVNDTECGAKINTAVLHIKEEAAQIREKKRRRKKEFFHRAPRSVSLLEEGTIKIDEPPAPHDDIKHNAIMGVIGSALSMSLPMLLGCAFMIYASRVSGFSRGIFMYVGLVTAVTSAVIGAVRGVTGLRNSQKEYAEYERLRNEKYGEYLKEQEEEIRLKYEKNTALLRERYLPAGECCEYDSSNQLLWSRNIKQPDFLSHRLGIGDLDFQIEIETPGKKFSMTDNNLSEIPENIRNTYKKLKDVPVCIDFLKQQLVGVIGGNSKVGAVSIAHSLIAQIAASNSYTDVKLVLFYDEKTSNRANEWSFVSWLPHVWNETKTFRYIASDKESAGDVAFELNKIIRKRVDESCSESTQMSDNVPRPYYIVIIASPELIENELVSQYFLDPKPLYGMSALYLVQRYEELPNQCEFIIENSDAYQGIYETSSPYELRTHVKFDEVQLSRLELLADNLASIELKEIETGGDIPGFITMLEMYQVKRVEELDIISRWKKNRTYDSLRALVGQKAGGAPCYLDIHEKHHGPHGLVAGTTGSGKSETLQTFLLSLAINYSPDDIGFFIIDYKGGGMANLFKDLPHVIGQISNLSGNQIQRALLSIQSEKDRRETLFANYGVKDIKDYTKLYKNNEATVPLPHIIIVIDEFAEMKKEEPEFIQEIISVSRVGRSLGIHLIMATQKPAGSVSDDIWANSRFKLCLRVQSRQDSTDMLHKPDAAYLTQSGRCYLQVGNDELYELFQSGYSGAVYYDDEAEANADIAQMIEINGVSSIEGNHERSIRQKQAKITWISGLLNIIKKFTDKIAPIDKLEADERNELIKNVFEYLGTHDIDFPSNEHNRESLITLIEEVAVHGYDAEAIVEEEANYTNAKRKLPQKPEHTELEAIVAHIGETAQKYGYNNDFSLFLPELSESISVCDVDKQPIGSILWNTDAANRKWQISVPLGIYDDPYSQRQDIYNINFNECGNIIIFGAPATGKSTMLQTIVYELVSHYSPSEASLYIMELSARKFSALSDMPQIGGIIHDNDEAEYFDKLFTMLGKLLSERKRILGEQSFAGYAAANRDKCIPAIFLIIDNFAAFVNKTGDKYFTILQKMTKEGLSYGIFVIASAGGTGSGEVPNSLAQNFRTVICLELNNAYDYGNYMRATHLRMKPESGIKGRGIARFNEKVLEFQTAAISAGDDETTVSRTIKELAKQANDMWKNSGHTERAKRIPMIPENPVWDEFKKLDAVKEMLASDRHLPFGYDTKYADAFGIDLSGIYIWLVTGSKGKGKTNSLKAMMCAAAERGDNIVIADFQKQYTKFAGSSNSLLIQSAQEWGEYLSRLLKEEVLERNKYKNELSDRGLEDYEIFEQMQAYKKLFIFIDDLPYFIRCITDMTDDSIPKNLIPNMEMLLEKGAMHNIFWFVTIDKENVGTLSSNAIYRLFTRDKKGLHLGGMVHMTAVAGMNFENHDRRTIDNLRQPGRGMLPIDCGCDEKEIVVPLVKGMLG